jgi:hypothetical protein
MKEEARLDSELKKMLRSSVKELDTRIEKLSARRRSLKSMLDQLEKDGEVITLGPRLSPEARKRISLAQKKRHAAARAAAKRNGS